MNLADQIDQAATNIAMRLDVLLWLDDCENRHYGPAYLAAERNRINQAWNLDLDHPACAVPAVDRGIRLWGAP